MAVPTRPAMATPGRRAARSEEHTSELQSQSNLVCRLLLEKKKKHADHSHARYFLQQDLLVGDDPVATCRACYQQLQMALVSRPTDSADHARVRALIRALCC